MKRASMEELMRDVAMAETLVYEALQLDFPIGCTVEYRLRDGVPTQLGKVTKHIGGREAKMRVLLAPNLRSDPSRKDDRYETTLPFRKIIRRVN